MVPERWEARRERHVCLAEPAVSLNFKPGSFHRQISLCWEVWASPGRREAGWEPGPAALRGDLCAWIGGARPRAALGCLGTPPKWVLVRGERGFGVLKTLTSNLFRARRFCIPRISLNLGSGRRWWHPVIHQRCAVSQAALPHVQCPRLLKTNPVKVSGFYDKISEGIFQEAVVLTGSWVGILEEAWEVYVSH